MSNHLRGVLVACIRASIAQVTAAVVLFGCAGNDVEPQMSSLPEPIDEQADISISKHAQRDADVAVAEQAWSTTTHVNVAAIGAQRWQLPGSRIGVISKAADDPDTYEAGLDTGFNQQWSHAYLYSILGSWIWGDANENVDDCITGRLAGQVEGPECKDGLSASYYYAAGNQPAGDEYLGYAIHYIEDVSLVLHASDPTLAPDMLTNHLKFEDWVKNNWTVGHNFSEAVLNDNHYYPVTDLQQSVRNAAWAASYWNSSSPGHKAWIAYRSSNYPTGVGAGNADLAAATTQMLIRAGRYAAGLIKYTLDTYGEWSNDY